MVSDIKSNEKSMKFFLPLSVYLSTLFLAVWMWK